MGKKRIKLARRVKRLMAAGLVGCLLYGECMQANAIELLDDWSTVQTDVEVAEEDYADSEQDAEDASDYDSEDSLAQELPETDVEEENVGEDAGEEAAASDEGEVDGDEEIVEGVENGDDDEEGIGAKASEFTDNSGARNDSTHIYASGGNYVGYDLNFKDGGFNELVLTGDFINKCKFELRLDSFDGQLVRTIRFDAGKDNWIDSQIQTNTIQFKVPELVGVTGKRKVYFVFKDGGYNFAAFRINKTPVAKTVKVEAESFVNHDGFNKNGGGQYIDGMQKNAWALYNVDLGDGGYNQITILYGSDTPGGTVRFYLCGADYQDDENYKESSVLLGEIKFEGTGSWNMVKTVACNVPDLTEVKGEVKLVIEWEATGDNGMNADYFELSADGMPKEEEKPGDNGEEEGIGARATQYTDNSGARNDGTHIYIGQGYTGYKLDFGEGGYNELAFTGDFINSCEFELRLDASDGQLVRTIRFDAGKGNWVDANIQTNTLTFKVPELASVTGEHVVYFVFKKGNYNFAAFRFYQKPIAKALKIEAESCIEHDGFDVNENGTGSMKDKAWALYNVALGDGGYNQISIRYSAGSQGGTVRFYLCGEDYSDNENYKESGKLLGETEFERTGSWDTNATVACYVPDLTEVMGNTKLVIEWESPNGDYLMNADYFELSADGRSEEKPEELPPGELEGGLKVEAESYIKGEGISLEGNHLGGMKTQAWAMYRVDLGTGGYNQISIRYGADTIGGRVRLWLGNFEILLGEAEFEGTGDWDMNFAVAWNVPDLAEKTGYVYLAFEWLSPEGESDWLMNPDYFKLYRDEEPDEGDEPVVDEDAIKVEAESYTKGEGVSKEGDHLGGLNGANANPWAMYNVDLADGGYNQISIRYGSATDGGTVRLYLGGEDYKENGKLLGETAFGGTGGWSTYDKVAFYVGGLAEETGLVNLVVEWEGTGYLMNPDCFELSKNGKDDNDLTIQEKAKQGFASFLDAYYVKYRYNKGFGRFAGGAFWDNAEMFEVIIDAYEHTGDQEYLDIMYEFFKGFTLTPKQGDWGWANTDDWSWNYFNDDIAWMTIACTRAYLNTKDEIFLNAAVKNFETVWIRGWDKTFLGGGLWWETDNASKNACINCPMAIAACLLGEATGTEEYYEKAKQIMDWVAVNLYDEEHGNVYDSYNINGEISKWASTYNQGTFIGANTLLYGHYKEEKVYYERARKAADYTINDMFKGGVMNSEGNDGNLVGFKGILARWLNCFNEKCDEPDVMEWLQKNAESAWKNRNSYGLMNTQFANKTKDDVSITAFNASSAVSVLFNCWTKSSQKPEESDPSPTPSPIPTEEPSPIPSPSPTEEPSPSPTPSPTEEPSPTPSPSPTEEPTPTPSPTEEPSPIPSPSPTEEPTPTPSPTEGVTPSPNPTIVPTPTPDASTETPEKTHTYGEPRFIWNSDDSVSAVFTCTDGDDSYTVEAVVTSNTENGMTVYVASVTGTDGIPYTSTKTIVAVESDAEEAENLRTVVAEGIDEIPESLIEAGLDTEEKIENVLFENLLVEESDTVANFVAYDIVLQISEDNGKTWMKVDPENFPAEGIIVMIPYPEGTDKEGYDFIVAHMFTIAMNGNQPGDVEILAVTKTDMGLQFTVTSLSPIAVSWKAITTEAPDTEVEDPEVDPVEPENPDDEPEPSKEPDDTETPDDTEKSESPDDTETPDDTEKSEGPNDTGTPDNTEKSEGPDDSETPDDAEVSENPEGGEDSTPKTGDSSSWFTWLMLCGFSACVATMLAWKERKKAK